MHAPLDTLRKHILHAQTAILQARESTQLAARHERHRRLPLHIGTIYTQCAGVKRATVQHIHKHRVAECERADAEHGHRIERRSACASRIQALECSAAPD